MRTRFMRDLWLGRTEGPEWREVNDQVLAHSVWRRMWRRLRSRRKTGEAG
jgi:hypothetical protein